MDNDRAQGGYHMDAFQLEIVDILDRTELDRMRSEMDGSLLISPMTVQFEDLFGEQIDHYLADAVTTQDKAVGRERGPPPWAIGFSRQFKKDTEALDRKLMGRVLEVLEEVSDLQLPFEVRGDTFKPLSGALGGCWRYRLGDWRLVLRPVISLARIDALTLAARGSVYD